MCVIDTDDILCACVDVGPHPPAGYQQHRDRVDGLYLATHGKRMRQSATMDSLWLDVEQHLEGVTESW